jgi:hypothetical protein
MFYFNKSPEELRALIEQQLRPLKRLLGSTEIYSVPVPRKPKHCSVHDESFAWLIVEDHWGLTPDRILSITRYSACAFGGHAVLFFFSVQLQPDVEVPPS